MKTTRLTLLSIAIATTPLMSADFTWDGGGTPVSGEYLWTDQNNWVGDVVPSAGSGIYIRNSTGTSIAIPSAVSLTALWFQPMTDLSGPSSSFTLSGETITISSTTGIQNQSGSLQTINNDLVFSSTSESTIRGYRYQSTAPLNGPGNLTLNGSVTTNAATINLRADNTSVITVNGSIGGVSGGSVAVRAGGDSSGTVYLNGANHISALYVAAGSTYLGNASAVDVGVQLSLTSNGSFFFMNGYNLEVSSMTNSGDNNARQRIFNGSATATTLTYNRSTTNETFTGQLSDSTTSNRNNFALVKKGTNTLTLAPLAGGATAGTQAGNLYNGGTSVQAGTLLISNPNVTASATTSATGSGAVTVDAGATFGGNGYASGAVTVDGTLRAGLGDSASGTLRLGGNLTMLSGSVIELSLGADGAHSTLARLGSGTWSFDENQEFTLLDFGMEQGTYTSIITGLASVVDTSGWTVTNDGWTATFTYNSGSIDMTVVPEPSTAVSLLGAMGLLVLNGARRRNRAVRPV